MPTFKISKKPDFKQMENEIGVKIKNLTIRKENIFVEIDEVLTPQEEEKAVKVFEKHFPACRVTKENKSHPVRGLGKPNVDKTKLARNRSKKEKLREARAALKHYERVLSYYLSIPVGTPKEENKRQRQIRMITNLRDKASRELEELTDSTHS